MAKIECKFDGMSYCDKLWLAKSDFFLFLELSIKYLSNISFETILAFSDDFARKIRQSNSLQNSLFWTYIENKEPCKII